MKRILKLGAIILTLGFIGNAAIAEEPKVDQQPSFKHQICAQLNVEFVQLFDFRNSGMNEVIAREILVYQDGMGSGLQYPLDMAIKVAYSFTIPELKAMGNVKFVENSVKACSAVLGPDFINDGRWSSYVRDDSRRWIDSQY